MKKVFLFTVAILLSFFNLLNEFSVKCFISFATPRMGVLEKAKSAHLALLDRGNMSNDIFKRIIKVEEEITNQVVLENKSSGFVNILSLIIRH